MIGVPLFNYYFEGGSVPSPPTVDFLIQQGGLGFILQQDGSNIVLQV